MIADFQQKDEIWYDYDRKKSAYLHTTTYQDGTDRTFKLISHFNEVGWVKQGVVNYRIFFSRDNI